MIIKTIEVKNFRSINDEHMDFDNLTAILGRNGAGKSSFLHAIDTFYDLTAVVTEEDFYNRNTNSPIEIRITYSDLRDDEKREFAPYIRDDALIVTKRITKANEAILQRYYAAAYQMPAFAKIREIPGKRDRINAWNELVANNTLPELGGPVKKADDVDILMAKYEAEHHDLLQPIEREGQFFGPKNVGGGKLDNFTKFVLVPAVREASDEATGKKGAIYQILDMIVLRKINAREDVQAFQSEFEERIKDVYSSENLTELPELGDSISKTLEKFAPGSKLNLQWDKVTPPKIQLPAAIATLVEDSFEGAITRKGHGLQRALIVTLLQHLAMTAPAGPTAEGSAIEENPTLHPEGAPSLRSPDLIIAIEEPELYLHPSRCRYLCNLFVQLANEPELGLGARNQIIYTSHSPYFVDLYLFDRIRVVRKETLPDSLVPQSIVKRFSLNDAAREMARVCQSNPANFTRESFKARAMSVMNTIVNEGYFADVVVVVEGLSEVGALWKIQEIMNKNWSGLGIAVIPAGGKNNIDRPTVIFRGLSIPTYFIFDADAHLTDKKKNQEAKERNHRYLRLANVPIVDFPDTQVHKTWAVFNKNLECILKDEFGNDNFQSIREQVAFEFEYDDTARVCKNIEGIARLIELAYEKGHRTQTLESIVDKIITLKT
jgi:hypothetical protein